MEKQSIQNFEDFLPRSTSVLVGSLDVPLKVEELVASKRDALLRLVLEEADVIRLIGPFIRGLRGALGGGTDDEVEEAVSDLDFEAVFSEVKGTLMNILGGKLTKISAFVLDTKTNRRIAGIGDDVVEVDGIYSSAEMHRWVSENLTMRQEQEVVRAVLTTNDFVGLVKNYYTLIAGTANAVSEKKMEA